MWGNAVHRSLEPCMARDGSGGDHLRALPQVVRVLLCARVLKILARDERAPEKRGGEEGGEGGPAN